MASKEAKISLTVAEAGRRGGKARLTTMTAEERTRVAKLAAEARWQRKSGPLPPNGDGGGKDAGEVSATDKGGATRIMLSRKSYDRQLPLRLFATAAAVLIAILFFFPSNPLWAYNPRLSVGVQGASPEGYSIMGKSVLRKIAKREQIFRHWYRETLECGHTVEDEQPWLWDEGAHLVWLDVTAKRRRCTACQRAIDIALLRASKKSPQSVCLDPDQKKVA